MRYRVAFAKRFQSDGNESVENPTREVDIDISDDVIADKVFVGHFDPEVKHSQEVLDEDDAWNGMAAAELWEYDVVDGYEDDFVSALQNAQTVMEFSVVDESPTGAEDLSSGLPLDESGERIEDFDLAEGLQPSASTTSSVDDGPAGNPTSDSTAGGLNPGRPTLATERDPMLTDETAGGIEDLQIVSAADGNLGLTNYQDQGPEDWATDTGPTKNPDFNRP
jgi:hypothetical protein